MGYPLRKTKLLRPGIKKKWKRVKRNKRRNQKRTKLKADMEAMLSGVRRRVDE